jgi:hypothetical protein
MLVASLHQGIVDVHPTRLEFYEGWLNPGLRDGHIGLRRWRRCSASCDRRAPYDRVPGARE